MDTKSVTEFDFPALETPRLRLRELALADAADVFVFAGDPVVQLYDGGPVASLDEVRSGIERDRVDARARESLSWGITLKPGDTVIGRIGLANWSREHHRAEIGYDIARAYWRQGIGTEAVAAVVRYAFEELHLHRLEAFPTLDNVASVRLLEKLGFVHEGTARQVLLMDDGAYHSVGQYSMIEDEYRRLPWGRDALRWRGRLG